MVTTAMFCVQADTQQDMQAYRQVAVLRLQQEPDRCSMMVILQWRLVIVSYSQWMRSLNLHTEAATNSFQTPGWTVSQAQ